MWIYEMKKSFQFEIQKSHVINKIKCLILETVENYEKLNFIWQKTKDFIYCYYLVWILIKRQGDSIS